MIMVAAVMVAIIMKKMTLFFGLFFIISSPLKKKTLRTFEAVMAIIAV